LSCFGDSDAVRVDHGVGVIGVAGGQADGIGAGDEIGAAGVLLGRAAAIAKVWKVGQVSIPADSWADISPKLTPVKHCYGSKAIFRIEKSTPSLSRISFIASSEEGRT
jgi:hypothetical protein